MPLSESLPLDSTRAGQALINGARYVFGGAAGGFAFNIVVTGGSQIIEFLSFLILIGLTGLVEYQLLGAEPEDSEEQLDELRDEILEAIRTEG